MIKATKQLLIIGYVWPEPDSSAAGRRMMELISIFQSAGWQITFATSAAESEYRTDLESLGVETVSIEVNSSTFDDFVSNLQPAAVLFDRFVIEEQFGWRVAEQCPNALRILDTEDLHFLRRSRKEAVKEEHTFTENDLLDEDTAKREIASIYRSDLSLIISEYEMQLLTSFFDIDDELLCYIPFLFDEIDKQKSRSWPSFDDRKHFMTIGNFHHPPNWDSVWYLHEKIWPLIRKELPEAQLHIYGSYVTQQARELHNPEKGFFIEGRAKKSQEVIQQARIMLAPLRFGAGLKGKLIEAMQCGTPSVTTAIGAEGLNGELPWAGEIADSPEDIAFKAVELYSNQTAWSRAQKNGINIINNRFVGPDFTKQFMERVKKISDSLESHRRQNFMGQMLQHHRVASTEYMSRWIEEKNS
ncbi:Glycosyltransferase involved in cell wall bisynthesis [Fodinibius salinus]|uniref:Glycosyltransferase involved in cell wall bisynthesis n=1 Tax=Fodinibius salinus TaxID=860790 RepID=A0A5D3YNR7_9BACT|nr:glycosyltransferase [Fodinibius salinus]TYP95514.1 Glycosyltransferase involved in cell wall bisynthesis [Fodinibius salinus]